MGRFRWLCSMTGVYVQYSNPDNLQRKSLCCVYLYIYIHVHIYIYIYIYIYIGKIIRNLYFNGGFSVGVKDDWMVG